MSSQRHGRVAQPETHLEAILQNDRLILRIADGAGPAMATGREALTAASFLAFDASKHPLDKWTRAELALWVYDAERSEVDVDWSTIPEDVQRLHKIKRTAQSINHQQKEETQANTVLGRLGGGALALLRGATEVAEFTGLWVLAAARMVRGRTFFPLREFIDVTRTVSVNALPIVSLISLLVGLIISFLGAVVLRRFGAEFAVAYLVGFGMLREMGAIMTGIIMAGRTGAAFAAQIGSMKVNEELDALETFGIPAFDYLVLPRIMAMLIMMPLLTVYANVVGIFSGYLVAELMMNVPYSVFFREMQSVIGVGDFALGIGKAVVFGLLVGTSGCLPGLQCGQGANAVGVAATRAVVTGITLIILANALIDWAAAAFNF